MSLYLTLIALGKGVSYGRPGGNLGQLAIKTPPQALLRTEHSDINRGLPVTADLNQCTTEDTQTRRYHSSTHRYATAPSAFIAGLSDNCDSLSGFLPTEHNQPAGQHGWADKSTGIISALAVASARFPGKVENATRESWARSGLRISPFRLQTLYLS
ncbi:hypothetical protein C8R45DRAFT_204889 [Mycena sanguinolenta]|nr:hypothetical protein C8R45DRAFT_204889 [Mycena sanguinolenta]